MATKTRVGIALPILLIAGGYVVVTETEVGQEFATVIGLGEEPQGMAVPPRFHGRVKTCTAAQVVSDKRCGDDKILSIDAKRMPYIARNITLAWEARPETAPSPRPVTRKP